MFRFCKVRLHEILLFVGISVIIGIVLTSGCIKQSEQKTSGEVPQDYVFENSITPTPKIDSTPAILSEKQKLLLDINYAPYNISEFKENIFDCSNMAALLHDWLETQTQTKWNVEVWFGCESPSCKEGHEWLEVIGKESNYTIEVTSKKIVEYLGNSNESYREYYSYYNRHYSSLPTGSGGFIDPRENTYPKRW